MIVTWSLCFVDELTQLIIYLSSQQGIRAISCQWSSRHCTRGTNSMRTRRFRSFDGRPFCTVEWSADELFAIIAWQDDSGSFSGTKLGYLYEDAFCIAHSNKPIHMKLKAQRLHLTLFWPADDSFATETQSWRLDAV